MDKNLRKRLEAAGFRIGTVTELLGLTPEDEEYINIRIALADLLAEKRKAKKYTQVALSKRMRTSQPRIANAEAARSDVSFDFLIRGLLTLGTPRKEIGKAIARL